MIIQVNGSMGDELGMTAAVRELKRQRPDEMIQLWGGWNREIWINNPYLNIGNVDSGRLVTAWSFYRTHRGSRTRLNFKLLELDPVAIVDELPEFYWTAEELAKPIRVKWSAREEDRDYRDLDGVMAGWTAPVIAIDPGAGWESRRWPEARFGELAVRLDGLGYQVVQVGTGRETLPGVTHNFVKRFKLRDLARFLGRCALFIGNDSGYFHVAAAVGCPHVTIYGPTRNTCGPYPGTVSVAPKSNCSPKCFMFCGRSVVSEERKAVTRHCMDEISVDEVLEAAREALARPRPPSRLTPAPTKAAVYEAFQGNATLPAVQNQIGSSDCYATLDQALKHTGKRLGTFGRAIRLAKERGAKTFVETGTFRSWDAGGSTALFAHLAAELGAKLVSIDVAQARLEESAAVIGPALAERVEFLRGDSVEVLAGLAASGRKIDLLYLDSIDVWEGDKHQRHQLEELKAAYPALAADAIVLLDDDEDDRGKGALARPWLLEQGWKCLAREYQSIFVRQ